MDNIKQYALLFKLLSDGFDGASLGKKVTQKMFYFFERKGVQLNLRYGIHFFGPYSAKLDNIMHILESEDYISIDTTGMTHVISMGDRCVDGVCLTEEQSAKAESVIREFAHKSPLELEALATMDYVANTILHKGANDREIIEKFIEIKGQKFSHKMAQETLKELRAEKYIA